MYKGSYFEELTNEVTKIQLENVDYDRWGDTEYSDEMKPLVLIRAPRYTSKKGRKEGDYDVYINNIAQHTLNEVTLLTDEPVHRIVKRLVQLDEHINKAWKVYFEHWHLFDANKFSSLNFQWSFFHLFSIPVTDSAGIIENPNFNDAITTDNFFWDLHDAMMYKQGAIKWILWHLRDQVNQPQGESQHPQDNGLPSVDMPVEQVYHNSITPQMLKSDFVKLGFEDLPKVNSLSEEQREKLYKLIAMNHSEKAPHYLISMLNYLGFIQILQQRFKTKEELYKNLARMTGREIRSIKGNISILSADSGEDQLKFRVHGYHQVVAADYENLKNKMQMG